MDRDPATSGDSVGTAPAPAGDDAPRVVDLRFRGALRRYQQTVVDGMAAAIENDRHHVVAPPGSGKTVLGIELVRRLGERAIVFAPTTVIQQQWARTIDEQFAPEGAAAGTYASTGRDIAAPISVFTYQLIATPDSASDELDQLAIDRWRADLIASGVVATAELAGARVEEIGATNPAEHRRELARRRQELRRELLRAPGADVYDLLHANARELIDRIAATGVRTIVLDECHHLLDYWAIVLRALVARLESPVTVGLTATLPDLDTERAFANYDDLVGPVDFETPVPAVVREGHLAPYRDLVLFVHPTEREQAWLDDVAGELARATADVQAGAAWAAWFDERLAAPLADLLERDGDLLVAAMRSASHGGRALPAALELPADVVELAGTQPPTVDDQVALLAAFVLERLVPSDDPADHELAARLRSVVRAFGATVTERGLRRSRSAGDLLLAVSDARIDGAVRVLRAEHEALGADLRGVVVTDFDRDRSGVQVVDDVVGSRAGGARRAAERAAADAVLAGLGVVLVTGERVACSAAHADQVRAHLVAGAREEGLDLDVEVERADGEPLAILRGSGADWRPGRYVPLVTAAFVDGEVQVLVGTRALLGEGWDAPAANVLVDLTSVASAQAVQQLRGRTMRLDPDRPGKVAHNWDIVCIDPRSRDGDPDLRRFVRRHERLWGIVPRVDAADVTRSQLRLATSAASAQVAPLLGRHLERLGAATEGGVLHVDPLLAVELAMLGSWTSVGFDDASRRSLRAVGERDATRTRWQVGSPFDDELREGTRLRPPAIAPVTSHTMRRIGPRVLLALAGAVTLGWSLWATTVLQIGASARAEGDAIDSGLGAVVLLGSLVVVVVAVSWRAVVDVWRLLAHGAPSDAVLVDSARAVFDALRACEVITASVHDSALRIADRDGEVVCWLDGVGVAESEAFANALAQLHEPIRDQRWIVERRDGRAPAWMDLGISRAIAWTSRRIGRRGDPVAWLAVPRTLASSARRREAFVEAWERLVGPARLVDSRSAEGTIARARARAQRADGRGVAEAWRSWS